MKDLFLLLTSITVLLATVVDYFNRPIGAVTWIRLTDICFVYSVILLISLIVGCTPRTGLAHQYHVAAITINGEVTETDFLLGEK